MLFKCKPINPKPTQCHILGHYPPALTWYPGPGTRQGIAPTPQSLLKLFQLANPKPAYTDSPTPSHGNHNKGFAHRCAFTLLTLVLPQVALNGMEWPLLSRTVRKELFPWQSASNLLVLPYLKFIYEHIIF